MIFSGVGPARSMPSKASRAGRLATNATLSSPSPSRGMFSLLPRVLRAVTSSEASAAFTPSASALPKNSKPPPGVAVPITTAARSPA